MTGMFIQSSNQHYSEEFVADSSSKPQHIPITQIIFKNNKKSTKSTTTGSDSRKKLSQAKVDSNDTPIEQDSQRRQRNKEAAKRSRAKNKQKFDRLEEREIELQNDLIKKKQQLAEAKQELQKYLSKNTLVINLLIQPNSMSVGKQMTYNRLEQLTQQGQCLDQDEVNLILDTLKLRVGATCRQRQSTIEYYFKQWIHLNYPALHRFFMWTASEGIHDFGDQPVEWAAQFRQKLGLTPQQQRQLKQTKEFFVQSKEILTRYIDDIHEAKHGLEIEGQKLEQFIADIRTVASPQQCAQVILFCQKNKYKRQMHLWSQKNLIALDKKDQEFQEPPARKQVKL